METKHTVTNGTAYDARTPGNVIRILERSRTTRQRIRVHFGDTATGRDWLEEWDVTGHVGRSTGPIKIPLMIANERSTGGPGILDHCIVKIRTARGGVELYKHPNYNTGAITFREEPGRPDGLIFAVHRDGQVHARFKMDSQRRGWMRKMGLVITEP